MQCRDWDNEIIFIIIIQSDISSSIAIPYTERDAISLSTFSQIKSSGSHKNWQSFKPIKRKNAKSHPFKSTSFEWYESKVEDFMTHPGDINL